jgi:hypothetical protein
MKITASLPVHALLSAIMRTMTGGHIHNGKEVISILIKYIQLPEDVVQQKFKKAAGVHLSNAQWALLPQC